jgi:hypothetical protein
MASSQSDVHLLLAGWCAGGHATVAHARFDLGTAPVLRRRDVDPEKEH